MAEEFKFDVFLSHSSRDKDVVREIANRLRSDGVKVWFDEWIIKPGDSIPAKIEDGLEHSRVLVLCLSQAALAADWPQLESHTFRFKDPLNPGRRFIPLRLDDTPTKGSLAQFSYIDWRTECRAQEYPKLLEACSAEAGKETVSSTLISERAAQLDYKAEIKAYAFTTDGSRVLTAALDESVRLWDGLTDKALKVFSGHAGEVWCVAWSPDCRRALSGAKDNTVRIWDVDAGLSQRVLEGHSNSVRCVAWSPNQEQVLSGGDDKTLRLWNVESGRCIRVFEGHSAWIWSVAWSSDARRAISTSDDSSVRVWDIETGRCLTVFEGHSNEVYTVAWSPDERWIVSGGMDKTVRLWDLSTGKCSHIAEGHTHWVKSVAWSADQRHILSGSKDKIVRLWDAESARCLYEFTGHADEVWSVGWSGNGKHAFSGDRKGGIRVWDLSQFKDDTTESLKRTTSPTFDQVQYTNAKVLLVGNSAAGKTGLSNRLALDTYKETDSTVGAWATQWKLPLPEGDDSVVVASSRHDDEGDDDDAKRRLEAATTNATNVEREVWLWDFGGQADQRLIHQLYMDQTQVAALVFDPQKDDVFETLGQWDRDLSRAHKDKADQSDTTEGSAQRMTKLLVAGRCDAGGLRVARQQIDDFVEERGYAGYLETSAKTGAGCAKLKQAIIDGIQWENIPWRSSPVLFKRLKDEIIRLKDEGRVLMRFNELREVLALRMQSSHHSPSDEPDGGGSSTNVDSDSKVPTDGARHSESDSYSRFTDVELKAVIGLLDGPGVVWELSFGSWILILPEMINTYGQAVIQTLRSDERELGTISEDKVLAGDLKFPEDLPELDPEEQRILLLAMHRLLLEKGFCFKEPTESGNVLVFPSLARRDRPEKLEKPSTLVSYQFEGFLDDLYATLIVRLQHTKSFELQSLWNGAADYKSLTGKKLGIILNRKPGGEADLLLHFDPNLETGEMMLFSKYVHEHLLNRSADREKVKRYRHWSCPCCSEPVGNRKTAMRRVEEQGRNATIICVECEERIPLWDELEEAFADPKLLSRAQQLDAKADDELKEEGRDRSFVGEIVSTVGNARQLCSELPVSDHGIDMEIEFVDDSETPTGEKVALILMAMNDLTRRKRDNVEIYEVNKAQWSVWMNHSAPAMLVHRDENGNVRWMEVRDHLKRITNDSREQIRQIEFVGKRFDVMVVRRWRDDSLGIQAEGQAALKIWREKLETFLREEAIVSSADVKFELRKRIQECRDKISELRG